jgi:hypothetical protein
MKWKCKACGASYEANDALKLILANFFVGEEESRREPQLSQKKIKKAEYIDDEEEEEDLRLT